jgi:hypothetical protein
MLTIIVDRSLLPLPDARNGEKQKQTRSSQPCKGRHKPRAYPAFVGLASSKQVF